MIVRVVGTGSWATALTQVLVDNNVDVKMYGISEDEVLDINENHRNDKYFDIDLDPKVSASTDISILNEADVILLGTPVAALESVLKNIDQVVDHPVYIINVSKGFHPVTKERLSRVIKEILKDKAIDVVSLIGPSHAEEVIMRLLTLVNSVCENEASARLVQELFANDYFRVYRNTDVVGAEIAAAIKNIMAIASGAITGLNQGDNAKAALMTRGLAEMTRFGLYFGGQKETFLGLNGVGDLIVTCSSYHSRNFQAGLAIGKADGAQEFLSQNQKTTEGVHATKAVYELAQEHGISMPITNEVYAVLFEGKKPSEAVKDLMKRELKAEDL